MGATIEGLLLRKLLVCATTLLCINSYAATQNEHCLAVTIYKEANTEGNIGKRAVLSVLESRVKRLKMSPCRVVAERSQFSFYPSLRKENGNIQATQKQLTMYRKIAKMAPTYPTAYFFHHIRVKPRWSKKVKYLGTIGKHKFYSFERKQNDH